MSYSNQDYRAAKKTAKNMDLATSKFEIRAELTSMLVVAVTASKSLLLMNTWEMKFGRASYTGYQHH